MVRADPLDTKELPTMTMRKLEAPLTITKVVRRPREAAEVAAEVTPKSASQMHNCSSSNNLYNNLIESCMIPSIRRKRSLFMTKINLNTRHSKTLLAAETQGNRGEDRATIRITKSNLPEVATQTNTQGEVAEAHILKKAGIKVATTQISMSSPIAIILVIISTLHKERAEDVAEEAQCTSFNTLKSFILNRNLPRLKERVKTIVSTIKVVTSQIIIKAISTTITRINCRLLHLI